MDNGRPSWVRRCLGWLASARGRWSVTPGGERSPDAWPGGATLRRMPWRSTVLIAVLVQVGTRFAAHEQPDRAALDGVAEFLLLAGSLLLLLRHRFPRVVAFGAAIAALLYLGGGYPYGPVFLFVAIGCLAAVVAGRRVAAWSAVGLLWAGHLLVTHWLYRWLPPAADEAAPWGQELIVAGWAVAIVAASELGRVRREQLAHARAERAAAERRRADEERLRIARELHDVLAHSLSVINVQAGVGLALLDDDPEQARTALTTIKGASKEALGEVRQVLDTLRAQGRAPRSPAPGLARLPELTEQAKSAGLDVAVSVEGRVSGLPPGADLAAFRIVQEALTNIVRHSGARSARVHLGRAADALRLRIDDDGPATAEGSPGGGNGLVGMRERAAALGGEVQAGPRADGGFTVRATIPLRGSSGTGRADGAAGGQNGGTAARAAGDDNEESA
ncbi:sensor histidine kinase [Streptomyces ochraceiscleroticus]|uniref:histidine kinase n=1 Tax=Streptomyces ochraceiscleroticus TaxID=47761 RepID=A0ABW1MR66_9ACTN